MKPHLIATAIMCLFVVGISSAAIVYINIDREYMGIQEPLKMEEFSPLTIEHLDATLSAPDAEIEVVLENINTRLELVDEGVQRLSDELEQYKAERPDM